MGHDHHRHGHADHLSRAFAIGVVLNLAFVIAELLAGWWAGSLALIADAGHNLSDVLGLLLAWGAHWLAKRPPSAKRTYGWGRGTILASLTSAVLLLVALGGITWEAVTRIQDPAPVVGIWVIAVASIGVVINAATAFLLHGHHHDLNVKGAYLHMVADAAVSVGVVIAGAAIMLTDLHWIDPAVTLIIVVVILWGTWSLLRDSMHLAMDGVPASIDIAAVEAYLREQDGVCDLHDLHIWAMSTTQTALTAHLVMPEGGDDAFLHRCSHELHDRFAIGHVTIQIESGDDDCHLADPASV